MAKIKPLYTPGWDTVDLPLSLFVSAGIVILICAIVLFNRAETTRYTLNRDLKDLTSRLPAINEIRDSIQLTNELSAKVATLDTYCDSLITAKLLKREENLKIMEVRLHGVEKKLAVLSASRNINLNVTGALPVTPAKKTKRPTQ